MPVVVEWHYASQPGAMAGVCLLRAGRCILEEMCSLPTSRALLFPLLSLSNNSDYRSLFLFGSNKF